MNTLQRLVSNTALAFISTIIAKASNSILFIFIGRWLGPNQAGIFNLGITYYTIAFGLSAWGLHELLVKELTMRRNAGAHYLVNYLFLRFLLAVGTYGILFSALALVIPYEPYTRSVIYILMLAVFPEAIFSICQAFFESHEKLGPPALAATTSSFVKLGAGLYLAYQGSSAETISWVIPLGSITGLVIFIPAIRSLLKDNPPQIKAHLNWQFTRLALKQTPNFLIIHIFSLLDYQTDAFLISILLDETHVGWYGAAQTTLLAFWTLPVAIRAAIYPIMTRYFEEQPERLAFFYETISRYLIIFILPAAAIISLFAQPIIYFIFDTSFQPAIPTLQWSIWAVVFGIINVPNARLLIIDNRQREAAWITGASMMANIVANLLLIPVYGIVGAAVARTIASFIFTALIYVASQKLVLRHNILPILIRPILAMIVMIYFINQMQHILSIPIALISGLVIYIMILIFSGSLSLKDKAYWQLLYKNRNL